MVAAGSMDGTVSLLSAVSGELLCSRRVHRKYVVSLVWAADGRTFVSASWDASFAVHRPQLSNDAASGACLSSLCLHHPRSTHACTVPSMRRLIRTRSHDGTLVASPMPAADQHKMPAQPVLIALTTC